MCLLQNENRVSFDSHILWFRSALPDCCSFIEVGNNLGNHRIPLELLSKNNHRFFTKEQARRYVFTTYCKLLSKELCAREVMLQTTSEPEAVNISYWIRQKGQI